MQITHGYNGAYDRSGGKIHGRAKQAWYAGAEVKVGFLTLTVIGRMPTPRDGRPDEWLLKNTKGDHYSFQPHLGLNRLLADEVPIARDRVARAHAASAA